MYPSKKPKALPVFAPSSPALIFFSISCSVVCIIALLLPWFVVRENGQAVWVSLFDPGGAGPLVFLTLTIICALFYVVMLYDVAVQSPTIRLFGLFPMAAMLLVFSFALYFTSPNANGGYVEGLTGIAYAAPCLAVVNYVAFVRRLTK